MEFQQVKSYEACLSLDLRPFNNATRDYGVEKFLSHLGFVPTQVFIHETYMDQIHTHSGRIDDTELQPHWVSQRAMPGAQSWTRRQYKELLDVLRGFGVKVYQGAEAAWSIWPEYGEKSRARWIYENLSEAFITYCTGITAKDTMGAINPLRRFSDGTYYEDRLIKDIGRFLIDYEMDGFFAADGFAGLACTLNYGDYAPDMVSQFTEHSGISIPAGSVPERARIIWEKHRYEWALFYSDRWAAFHKKLSSSLEKIGKDLVTFTPFQLGPADSLMLYGFDYGKVFRAGVKRMCLEVMEEITGRRFEGSQGWESIGISNAVTAGVQCPGLKILWTSSTCNCPEHWHTFRDLPSIIERECLAVGSATVIDENGKRSRPVDGTLTIFGMDLNQHEWRWFRERLDVGFGFTVKENAGPAIVWSDKILYEHAKRGRRWPLSATVAKLTFAGVPIHSAVLLGNCAKAKCRSLLLVNPIGLEDDDVSILQNAVENGCHLIVVGEVENARLLKLIGMEKLKKAVVGGRWKITAAPGFPGLKSEELPAGEGENKNILGGFKASEAAAIVESMADDRSASTALAVRRDGTKGTFVYIGCVYESMPPVVMKRNPGEERAYPHPFVSHEFVAKSVREVMESIIKVHPDSFDVLVARLLHLVDRSMPETDFGQILAFETVEGHTYVIVENAANLVYIKAHVKLPRPKKYVSELPIRSVGPVGYMFFGDVYPDAFDVTVPPEAGVPFKVVYKEDP